MNKFAQLLFIMVFLIIATLVVESLYLTASTDITTGIITEGGGFLSQIGSMVEGFWKIITFQVPGLPVFINLIIFYPLSIMVFFMVVDLIRG